MTYLVRASGGFVRRGRLVASQDQATVYAHPSAAKKAMAQFPGAELVPLSAVRRGAPEVLPGAVRSQVYLTPENRAKAARIGDGIISEGVRIALDNYKEGPRDE